MFTVLSSHQTELFNLREYYLCQRHNNKSKKYKSFHYTYPSVYFRLKIGRQCVLTRHCNGKMWEFYLCNGSTCSRRLKGFLFLPFLLSGSIYMKCSAHPDQDRIFTICSPTSSKYLKLLCSSHFAGTALHSFEDLTRDESSRY